MTWAKKTQTTTKAPGCRVKVLHVADYQDLFELADDVRKERSGPLRYRKSMVTLSSFACDAEVRHFERNQRLRANAERHLLRSIFEDLKNWTSGKQYGPRGFLVTMENRPATIEYLAEQLSLDVGDLKKALPLLEQLGFLERVPLNGQLEPQPPKRKTRTTKKKTSGEKKAKKSPKKRTRKNTRKSKTGSKATAEGDTKGFPDSAGMKRKVCAHLRAKRRLRIRLSVTIKARVREKIKSGSLL